MEMRKSGILKERSVLSPMYGAVPSTTCIVSTPESPIWKNTKEKLEVQLWGKIHAC